MNVKDIAFRAYALVFNAAAKLPVKENRAVFFNLMHGAPSGALAETERGLLDYHKQDTNAKAPLDILHVDRNSLYGGPKALLKFMTVDAFRMGRARYIFLNNNFFPFGWVHPNKETVITQVWHGQGAFKKFGLDIPQPPEVRAKEVGANRPLSYVTCSAESIRPIYMSAFGLSSDQVLTTGNPVSDYFFREENVGEEAVAQKRAAFDKQFPVCKGKYLVLYAPTFRDDPAEDSALLSHLDPASLKNAATKGAGRDAAVLVRLHPNDSTSKEDLKRISRETEGVVDATDYPDGDALTVLSDVLITDYSSICMNNALLHKPVVFYAYDLDTFEGARDFYYPYEETVGGPVVRTMEELCNVFENQEFQTEKLEAFRTLHFGEFHGGATEAMLKQLPGIGQKKAR